MTAFYPPSRLAVASGPEWIVALEREPANSLDELIVTAERLFVAYKAVGRPERAMTICEQLERELPREAGPPMILGRLYLDAGRMDAARAAATRALRQDDEHRTLALFQLRADIEEKSGDVNALISILDEAVTVARRLDHGRSDDGLAQMRAKLEARLADARRLPAR